ncbi:MAG: hypothetical protein JW807_02885 [Spirochaetes bacterium]|nr:hypothetical protein [Spirochaetota bacterium]
MGLDDRITEILDYVLNQATRFELELVGEALRKRMERESSIGMSQIDVRGMARSMAEGIEKQMGIGGEAVHRASRRLVADMIRNEKPDISEREMNALLDRWVPGKGPGGSSGMPRDMLLAMIEQFVSYSMGEMSAEEKREFPAGWHQKYWGAFPSDIQILIRDYIQGKIGKNQFWKGVRESPAMLK